MKHVTKELIMITTKEKTHKVRETIICIKNGKTIIFNSNQNVYASSKKETTMPMEIQPSKDWQQFINNIYSILSIST